MPDTSLPWALMSAALAGASPRQLKASSIILGAARAEAGLHSLACAFPEGWFFALSTLFSLAWNGSPGVGLTYCGYSPGSSLSEC